MGLGDYGTILYVSTFALLFPKNCYWFNRMKIIPYLLPLSVSLSATLTNTNIQYTIQCIYVCIYTNERTPAFISNSFLYYQWLNIQCTQRLPNHMHSQSYPDTKWSRTQKLQSLAEQKEEEQGGKWRTIKCKSENPFRLESVGRQKDINTVRNMLTNSPLCIRF